MGNGGEITVNHDKLNQARKALDEQYEAIQSLVLSDAPAASVFGGSSRGEWLANAVIKGNREVERSRCEAEDALQMFSEAVESARTLIEESDEYSAAVVKKMTAAVALMSNPLTLFSKASGPMKNTAI